MFIVNSYPSAVFLWKEFKGSGKGVYSLLGLMSLFFFVGLGFIVAAGV